jgi:hypothetical protein
MEIVVQSFQDLKSRYTRTKTSKIKKREVTVEIAPRRPGRSNLLHPEEQRLLSQVVASLWDPINWGSLTSTQWVALINQRGFKQVKDALKKHM